MKRNVLLLFSCAMALFASGVQAQTLVATYYRCDAADEGEADFIMNTVLGDIYQRHVDAGELLGWGWAEHQAGGSWRRIANIRGADRSAATTAWGQIVDEMEAEHPGALHRFREICGSHDDYIWNQLAASDGGTAGAAPGRWLSTYYTCDQVNQERADELQQEIATVYDKHIAAGHLGGWTWYAHYLGGSFRRLLTVFAAEDFDVLDGRDMVIDELRTQHADVMAEFNSICGTHVDYLWANARPTADN